MTHKVSLAAFEAAGDPDAYHEFGAPWQPLKLYYHMSFTKARVTAIHEALQARGLESPYAEWLERWADDQDMSARVTTKVPCGKYFELRDDALRAHATQVDPDGRWFHVPLDVQREIWPTEDYELVRAELETTVPEDDLFAGVRERIGS
jgi:mycothiol S-conjugate amidase